MKAVVYHGIGDIRLDNIKEPSLKHDFDAIVRLTASAICGTDLHFVRGTVPGMQEGTVLGQSDSHRCRQSFLCADQSRAANFRHRRLQTLRPPRTRLDQSRTPPRRITAPVGAQHRCAPACPGVRPVSSACGYKVSVFLFQHQNTKNPCVLRLRVHASNLLWLSHHRQSHISGTSVPQG